MECGKANFGQKGQKTPKIENFGPDETWWYWVSMGRYWLVLGSTGPV